MPKLDIDQALYFLDLLDLNGRHTIASEAPFGGFGGGPLWEEGATYESQQRQLLIEGIQARQDRGSNVYYGVNRPCEVWHQQGYNGKCNANDIIAIRALAFDIDITKRPFDPNLLLDFIEAQLVKVLRPSLVISTGGGYQFIYLLKQIVDVRSNPDDRRAITELANNCEALLRSLVPLELKEHIKIDNMSNVDRVMRLPGTINYPKAEKIAKGQTEALAHIAVNYRVRCDISALRNHVPRTTAAPTSTQPKRPYVQRPNDPWTVYAKAKFCVEWVRDCGVADANGWYSWNVMFPLMGEAIAGTITWDEAEELFLEAVSGGERYGGPGRGLAYFQRQWRSHLRSSRNGQRTLGSLIEACKALGMPQPWKNTVVWEESYQEQLESIQKLNQSVDSDTLALFKKVR